MWLLKIRYAYYFTHTISCPKQFSEGKSAGCKQSYQGLKAKIRDIIAYFHVSREDITWWWRQVTWQWRQCSPLSRRGDRTTFWRELQSEIPYCASLMLIYRDVGLYMGIFFFSGDILLSSYLRTVLNFSEWSALKQSWIGRCKLEKVKTVLCRTF